MPTSSIHFGYHERKGVQTAPKILEHDTARVGGGARAEQEHRGAGGAGRDTDTEDNGAGREIPSRNANQKRREKMRRYEGVYLRGSVYWIEYSRNGRQIRESAETNNERKAYRLRCRRLEEVKKPEFVGTARGNSLLAIKNLLAEREGFEPPSPDG